MKTANHTPGPWAVSKIGNPYDQHAIYAEPSGENVSVTVQGKANADLIAAAPELLAALELVANVADTARSILHKTAPDEAKRFKRDAEFCRATIAKAKGE